MEIKQLIYFVETARQEHMTEASLALNVAQSALSRQINLLENDLGIQLFKREGRNIKLTAEGEDFYEDAVQILEIVDRTKEKITGKADKKENTFNIHITRSDMTAKLLQSFQQFLRQADTLDFSIQTAEENELENKFFDQTLDIAVSTRKMHSDQLRSTLLFEQNFYYVFRESEKINLPVQATLSELEEFPIATLEPIIDMNQTFKNSRIYNYNDISIIQHLLMHHHHVAVLTNDEAKQLLYNYPKFTVHSLNHLNISQPMYVSMLKSTEKPFVSKWFNQLKQEFMMMSERFMN